MLALLWLLAAGKKGTGVPRKIHHHIANSKQYKELLNTCIQRCDIDMCESRVAVPILKELMHESASLVRDRMLPIEPDSKFATLQRLASCSNSVWNQDLKLVSFLLESRQVRYC